MATEIKNVTVPFSLDQHEALEKIADEEGRSMAAQVRQFCVPHLNRVIEAMKKSSKDAPSRIRSERRK